MHSFNGVVVVILLMVLNVSNSLCCTFIVSWTIAFCFAIVFYLYIYAHIVLYLSSRIVFSVLIEFAKHKLLHTRPPLAIAPLQDITPYHMHLCRFTV